MNLVVGSCFRNSSEAFVGRYFARVHALRDLLNREHAGHALHLVLVWGDSPREPKLAQTLQRYADAAAVASVQVVERSHGLGDYGSSTHPDRLSGFAYAANGVFERIGDGADAVIYVESDLIWQAPVLRQLVRQLKPGVDVLSPLTFVNNTDTHYDFWAVRTLDGEHVGSLPPYSRHLQRDRLTEVSSTGSCVLMRGEVARACRCSPEAALVGFCHQARALGYRVWVDAREDPPSMTKWLGFGARREHAGTHLMDVRPGVGDQQGDIRKLPFLARTWDGIECHHVIEHLSPEDAVVALGEVYRVLKVGGVLELSCPDLEACARTLLTGNLEILLNIYSPHPDEAQRHRWGYTYLSLHDAVTAAGFVEVKPMAKTEPHEIRLTARRPR